MGCICLRDKMKKIEDRHPQGSTTALVENSSSTVKLDDQNFNVEVTFYPLTYPGIIVGRCPSSKLKLGYTTKLTKPLQLGNKGSFISDRACFRCCLH